MPRFSQSRIVAELKDTFGEFLDISNIPFLEDLLNFNILFDYLDHRQSMNLDCMSPAPPTYAVNKHKSAAFVSAGRQGGVRSSKNALEPLVDVVDDKLTHLTKSLELAAEVRQPYNNPDPIDDDMEFAITQTIGYSHCLRKTRDALMGHILEIKK